MTKHCRASKKRKYNSRAAALRAGTQRYTAIGAKVDILGKRFGRLLVIGAAPSTTRGRSRRADERAMREGCS